MSELLLPGFEADLGSPESISIPLFHNTEELLATLALNNFSQEL